MRPFHEVTSRRLLGKLVPLVLGLAGCFTWRPLTPLPVTGSAPSLPYRVRITRSDSSSIVLLNPALRNDTIRGRTSSGTIAVPLATVASLEHEHFNPVRSLAVVTVVPIAAIGVFYLVECGGGG